jgi:hypothetical protein
LDGLSKPGNEINYHANLIKYQTRDPTQNLEVYFKLPESLDGASHDFFEGKYDQNIEKTYYGSASLALKAKKRKLSPRTKKIQ